MPLLEHTYSLLIISSSEGFTTSFKNIIPKQRFSKISVATNETEARRNLVSDNFDLIIINSPLCGESAQRLAIDLGSNKTTVVLLCVKNDIQSEIYSAVSIHGILTVAKPISRTIVLETIDDMCAYHERLRRLAKKTTSLETKMQEIRLVNRAKWLLIENEHMSEDEAHHYIEKYAMDHSLSKGEVAEIIKQKYGE